MREEVVMGVFPWFVVGAVGWMLWTSQGTRTQVDVSTWTHVMRQLVPTRDPAVIARVARAMVNAAEQQGVPIDMMVATGYLESRYSPQARSGVGACGVWQQLPQYSGRYSDRGWGQPAPWSQWNLTCEQLQTDVEQGARIAARYYGHLIRRYGYHEGIRRYAAGSNWQSDDAGQYVAAVDAMRARIRALYDAADS
jgi:hypothetical protein